MRKYALPHPDEVSKFSVFIFFKYHKHILRKYIECLHFETAQWLRGLEVTTEE